MIFRAVTQDRLGEHWVKRMITHSKNKPWIEMFLSETVRLPKCSYLGFIQEPCEENQWRRRASSASSHLQDKQWEETDGLADYSWRSLSQATRALLTDISAKVPWASPPSCSAIDNLSVKINLKSQWQVCLLATTINRKRSRPSWYFCAFLRAEMLRMWRTDCSGWIWDPGTVRPDYLSMTVKAK